MEHWPILSLEQNGHAILHNETSNFDAELLSIIVPIREAIRQTGLGVNPPVSAWSQDPSQRSVSVTAHAHTGAGGMYDIVVIVADDGLCTLFVGGLYDVPPGKDRRDVLHPEMKERFKAGIRDRELTSKLLHHIREAILSN